MSFRKNLAYLRKSKNLSQEDLAFKLDVSRQSVSKWESGGAYPETEKMLKLCKIFDCSLDDLMNQDIKQIREEENKSYSFKDILDEIKNILERTIKMLSSMKFKSLMRFLFELGLLFILVLLVRIPFNYIYGLGENIFIQFGSTFSSIFLSIWNFLVEGIYLVVAVILFFYIYKIRFLDKFEENYYFDTDKIEDENIKGETDDNKEKKVEVVTNKQTNRSIDFGVFSIFTKMLIFFIKCLLGLAALLILLFLPFIVAAIVVAIVWMFNGIFFIGGIILGLSLIVFFIVILKAIYNFILDRRSDWNRIFVFFIASILGLGVGMGVFALDLSKLTFVNSTSEHVAENTILEIYPMDENLNFLNLHYSPEYIVDNSLEDSVRIEVFYYSDFLNMNIEKTNENMVTVNKELMLPLSKLYSVIVEDLKENRVTDYKHLFNYDVRIYSSEENIEKLTEYSSF